MAGQQQPGEQRSDDADRPGDDGAAPPPAQPRAQDTQREEELDDLLDEIDGVLETDAQEFVHGFVQKGGQ